MKNIQLMSIGVITLLLFTLLKIIDGFRLENLNSILILSAFMIIIRIITGAKYLTELIQWCDKRRFTVYFWVFAVVAIGVQSFWSYSIGHIRFLDVIVIVIQGAFFFATCLVLGAWFKDALSRFFVKDKSNK
jgi:RsiW-degrading membrane proteinase PrsW (M82 family)